jgi:hypothetical protein
MYSAIATGGRVSEYIDRWLDANMHGKECIVREMQDTIASLREEIRLLREAYANVKTDAELVETIAKQAVELERLTNALNCVTPDFKSWGELARLAEARVTKAEFTLAAAQAKLDARANIMRYMHFVLCGTDDIKTDLGDEIQNAADAIKTKLEEAQDRIAELEGLLQEIAEHPELGAKLASIAARAKK